MMSDSVVCLLLPVCQSAPGVREDVSEQNLTDPRSDSRIRPAQRKTRLILAESRGRGEKRQRQVADSLPFLF